MRNRIVWLPLYLGVVVGKNTRNLVRVRGDPGTYYNTTSEITTTSSSIGSVVSDPPVLSSSDPTLDALSTSTYFPSDVTDSSVPECIDTTVTYTDTIPPTVYITVDGSYDVPVTASNVSVTEQPIFETPPPACMTTIIPANNDTDVQPSAVSLSAASTHSGHHQPEIHTESAPAESSVTGPVKLHVTSTVVVTKKTPVPVVQAQPTQPPVTFERPDPSASKTPAGNPVYTAKSEVIIASQPNGNTVSNGNYQATGDGASPTAGNSQPGSPNYGSSQAPGESLSHGIASIIASVINSPFILPQPTPNTPGFVAAPATPTIAGVPVTVKPSNVIIGTNDIPLPTESSATVVVEGQTFTVKPDEIIAPGTTYHIANQQVALSTITQVASTVTAAGVTLTVDATNAVISGTTYRIGNGARSTTVVVNGQTLSIGNNGVGFAGSGHTTFAPAMTIAGDYEIVVVDGLTVSVDQTEAVIRGMTYKIGTGAKSTSVVIDGKTISIGPGGVSLASTTILPTSVPGLTTTTQTSSSSTPAQATATSSNGTQQKSDGNKHLGLLADPTGWLFALFSATIILF